jgi:hypothetical protein
MTLSLNYTSNNRSLLNEDMDIDFNNLTIQPEDYEKAREIGVLTPRKIESSDSPSNTYEIEFLQMMDEREEHLEILDNYVPDFNIQSIGSDIPDMFTTQVVRITHVKNSYSLGSLGDNQPTSVYIPDNICEGNIPNLHDFYYMDLRYQPCGRNSWIATNIYPKLDTSSMLVSEEDIEHLILHTNHVFNVPIEHGLIGIIIGKEGKNLKNLTNKFHPYSDPPDITITPTTPGMATVSVVTNCFSEWLTSDIINLVSHMHA